jgi:hypothetical protein
LKIETVITNVKQSFKTEADGFTFTFQSNADSESEVEIIEKANDNDQSDEEAGASIYLPSSEPTPPPSPSPFAPASRPTTPPCSPPPPQSELELTDMPNQNQNSQSPEPKKVKKKINSAIRNTLELSTEAEKGQSAKHGLLKYFSKGTQEDRKAYFLREDERFNEARLQTAVNAKNAEANKRVRERDLARERQ